MRFCASREKWRGSWICESIEAFFLICGRTIADDRNFDPDGDGYTNLEEFLNSTFPLLTADFDFDSDVDENDLAIWRSAFGNSEAGDTDDDLDTDGADFLAWQRQFTGNLDPVAGSAAIPEPSTAILLVGLSLSMLGRRV